MQIKKINASKVKITLSESDMKLYSISLSDIEQGGKIPPRLMKLLLDEARIRTGFTVPREELTLKISKRDGIYEVYLTKQENDAGKPQAPSRRAFVFDSLCDLFALSSRLSSCAEPIDVSVFYGEGIWIISFPADNTPFFIGDFASALKDPLPCLLEEHFYSLYGNGDIKKLAELAR